MNRDFDRIRAGSNGSFLPPMRSDRQGSMAFLGRVISTGSNLGVGIFVRVQRLTILGNPSEGGSGESSDTPDGGTLVLFLGANVPAENDEVICWREKNRWVARKNVRYGYSPPITISTDSCSCKRVPATLSVSFSRYAGGTAYTQYPCWSYDPTLPDYLPEIAYPAQSMTYYPFGSLPSYARGGVPPAGGDYWVSPVFDTLDTNGPRDVVTRSAYYSYGCQSSLIQTSLTLSFVEPISGLYYKVELVVFGAIGGSGSGPNFCSSATVSRSYLMSYGRHKEDSCNIPGYWFTVS